ncbi:hypothetical protein EVAR_100115_1 [Eumeta japonica]|uniref:Reverse transcriptase/retrotransposon-derived protein RNase H-like domain-containing protein n=1 Tax=Eumeta variegata TaxID=151549 RepID=A0A4C1YW50_EUMVA|nr:hypothetical protein EVAR_100115_1 [Eumeta japonica]
MGSARAAYRMDRSNRFNVGSVFIKTFVQTAFERLKNCVCDPPILKHFENNDDGVVTRLSVDASGETLGASLMQGEKELREMRPIGYASRIERLRKEIFSDRT